MIEKGIQDIITADMKLGKAIEETAKALKQVFPIIKNVKEIFHKAFYIETGVRFIRDD